MPEVKFELSVWCLCGKHLKYYDKEEGEGGGVGYYAISIDTCKDCLKEAREEGHNKGFEIGYIKGLNESRVEGYKKCLSDVSIFLEELKEGIEIRKEV